MEIQKQISLLLISRYMIMTAERARDAADGSGALRRRSERNTTRMLNSELAARQMAALRQDRHSFAHFSVRSLTIAAPPLPFIRCLWIFLSPADERAGGGKNGRARRKEADALEPELHACENIFIYQVLEYVPSRPTPAPPHVPAAAVTRCDPFE